MPIDPLEFATQEFTPVPRDQRQAPPRIKAISTRLYIDKYVEHRKAAEFLEEMTELHGEGTKAFVRGVLLYDLYLRGELDGGAPAGIPAFTPIAPEDRQTPPRVKSIGVRLYIDKYLEHRKAAEIIASAKDLHGEGTNFIVRSLNFLCDNAVRPLEERARRASQLF